MLTRFTKLSPSKHVYIYVHIISETTSFKGTYLQRYLEFMIGQAKLAHMGLSLSSHILYTSVILFMNPSLILLSISSLFSFPPHSRRPWNAAGGLKQPTEDGGACHHRWTCRGRGVDGRRRRSAGKWESSVCSSPAGEISKRSSSSWGLPSTSLSWGCKCRPWEPSPSYIVLAHEIYNSFIYTNNIII